MPTLQTLFIKGKLHHITNNGRYLSLNVPEPRAVIPLITLLFPLCTLDLFNHDYNVAMEADDAQMKHGSVPDISVKRRFLICNGYQPRISHTGSRQPIIWPNFTVHLPGTRRQLFGCHRLETFKPAFHWWLLKGKYWLQIQWRVFSEKIRGKWWRLKSRKT